MGGGQTTTPVLTSNLGGSRMRHTGVPRVLLSMSLVQSLIHQDALALRERPSNRQRLLLLGEWWRPPSFPF